MQINAYLNVDYYVNIHVFYNQCKSSCITPCRYSYILPRSVDLHIDCSAHFSMYHHIAFTDIHVDMSGETPYKSVCGVHLHIASRVVRKVQILD